MTLSVDSSAVLPAKAGNYSKTRMGDAWDEAGKTTRLRGLRELIQ
ncbi:Uncharacterised protein [Legionella taurinensis]|nr:Uncharacterised protein [Legionella taurinensis]